MGILCCCFKKNDCYEDGANSESRPILDYQGINDGDPRDGHYAISIGNHGYGSTQPNGHRQSMNEDVQNQLYNRVLDQLSSRVIDITAIEKPGEQADLTDREHAIHKKLTTIRKSVVLDSNKPPAASQVSSRSDHYHHHRSKDPIPIEDFRLITTIATKSSAAVDYGFRIHDSEPFVVSFENAPY